MKKILLPIFICLLTLPLMAQTYMEDDFEGGALDANNAWTSQVVIASDTGFDWILDEFSGNSYAEMNNYNGTGNEEVEAWLISPAIDLSGAAMPVLRFDNLKRFSGQDLEVYVSSDYDGSSEPASATWTDITAMCNMDSDADSWDLVSSGDVDISAYASDNFTLAFRHQGSNSDGSISQIDNLSIVEGGPVSVSNQNAIDFNVYPNPATTELNFDLEGTHQLFIMDAAGNMNQRATINGNTKIALDALNPGMYFIQIEGTTKKVMIK